MIADAEDRVDADHQRAGDQSRAGDVGACLEAEAGLVLDQARRSVGGGDADRQVDHEDPVPADRLGEDAAEQQADRAARRGDEAVDADRFRLLARLREHRHDHAQDHRRGERAADAGEEAAADQHRLVLGDGAEQRGGDEDRETDQEHLALAEQVAKPAGQQQQAAEGDQVGVDDPGQAALGEAEAVLNRRQGDVDDRYVEDDHQHPRAEDVEGEPAVVLRLRHVGHLIIWFRKTTTSLLIRIWWL